MSTPSPRRPQTLPVAGDLPALLRVSSAIGHRSAASLDAVIDALNLDQSVRYRARDVTGDGIDETFCNIAMWDFSRAMNCEIPHWIRPDGSIANAHEKGARELRINDTMTWLDQHGAAHGFVKVDGAAARLYALTGAFASVWWRNPTGRAGHAAFLRSDGVTIAQAGRRSFSRGTIREGFGNISPLVWWVHA